MCDTTPKFAFKTRGDPLTFPGCKSLSVGLNRFSHPQITPESIPLPSALTLNRESCSELHHLFSQPFKTPAGSALHLACTFGKFSKLPTQYTPSSHLSLQRVRILLFYDNLDAQCVNAGLYIIYELPPPTLNSERLSELRHLFVQPLKTYASSVLGRIRILAFYDNVGALCIKAGLDIIHEPPPLTLSSERLSERVGILLFYDNLNSQCVNADLDIIHKLPPLTLNNERLSELHHLLSPPPKTSAGDALHVPRTFANTNFFILYKPSRPTRQGGLEIIHGLSLLTLSSERLSELHRLLSPPPKTSAGDALHVPRTFGKSCQLCARYTPS
ncbi:hypothetical protein B0H16DRAFT_1460405 [Mycena metata]|uniref:Uncharacterized protein n=1 Tax=Mycena metata TaxID=1033252 RepID=A0AAD7IX04_9AGAR|nr:hypothetical protein B0H16DRAFT_1460405 [Mycena metata]